MTKRKTKITAGKKRLPVRYHSGKKLSLHAGPTGPELSVTSVPPVALHELPDAAIPASLEGVKIDGKPSGTVRPFWQETTLTVGDVIKRDAEMISSLDLEPTKIEYPATWWDAFKLRWIPEWVYEGGIVKRPYIIRPLGLLRRKTVTRQPEPPSSSEVIKVWSKSRGPVEMKVDSRQVVTP
jgi:hypothetical protein